MALNLRASSAETSFFVSRQGYMGLLPFAAEEGDYICILYGCAVPLIVRPTSSGTILIGEAYVYGMMCGEMIEKVNGKEFQEEDFSFV
ncbi:hypothetical protein N431DRAFT_433633 [Stipitochalara longipes BDJ]|nr:hypothetical protein N431DRAFT_433633 [Stipitochalara longipes BDJ]